jgi:HD-like signal output (HDOD) protein
MYGAFEAYTAKDLAGLDVEELMRFNIRSAHIARLLAAAEGWPKDLTDQAFLAAMLQDIGKLVLAAEMPQQFSDYERRRPESLIDVEQLEQEIFGATHAQVGAYLVGLWGLPDPIVEAIAYHESPSGCVDTDFGVFGLVHVASRLALGLDVNDVADQRLGIDARYLARAGALDRWSSWSAIARSSLDDEASTA